MVDDQRAAELLVRAKQAAMRAYAPYSRFPVGAAALTADGRVYLGANIENASSPLTCCAERVAVFHAVMDGHDAILAIAVWAGEARGVTPCGACRQVLNEWRPADHDLTIILEGDDGPEQVGLAELLPRAFGPGDVAGTRPQGSNGGG